MKARIAKKRYKRLERTITEMHGQIRHLEWMAEREAAFRLPREGSFRRAGLDKSIDRREMRFAGMSEPPFLRIALVKRGDCLDRHLSVFSLVAAAMREAREQTKRDHWFNMSLSLRNKIIAALSAPPEPPSDADKMRAALEDTNRLLKHYAERIPMFADAFAQHIRDNDAALKGETK